MEPWFLLEHGRLKRGRQPSFLVTIPRDAGVFLDWNPSLLWASVPSVCTYRAQLGFCHPRLTTPVFGFGVPLHCEVADYPFVGLCLLHLLWAYFLQPNASRKLVAFLPAQLTIVLAYFWAWALFVFVFQLRVGFSSMPAILSCSNHIRYISF